MTSLSAYPSPSQASRLHLVPKQTNVTTYDDTFEHVAKSLGMSHAGMYIMLRRYANSDDLCSLSYNELADNSRVSRRQIIRLVTKLADGGWIKILPQYGPSGEYLSNVFYVPLSSSDPSDISDTIPSDIPSDMDVTTLVTPLVTSKESAPLDPPSSLSQTLSLSSPPYNPPSEKETVTPPIGPPLPPRKKAEHPLPPDFALTDDLRRYGREKGLDDQRIDVQFEKFKNYAYSKDWRKVDWNRTLQNWFLSEVERHGKSNLARMNGLDFDPLTLPANSPLRAKLTGKPSL